MISWQYILLTGSANPNCIENFLKQKYGIRFNTEISEYKLNISTKLIVDFDLNQNNQNFATNCNRLRSGLKQIICIENLNPEPDQLNQDITKLVGLFGQNELKSLLNVVFDSSLNGNLNRDEIERFSDHLNELFSLLGIENHDAMIGFISKNIFTTNTFSANRFDTFSKLFKRGLVFSILLLV